MKSNVLILALLWSSWPSISFGQIQELAFTHVTLVNPNDPPKEDMTVVIQRGRIAGVVQHGKPNPTAKVMDARGKYLIPGLWDMHTHTQNAETYFPMYLANGVTGVRDMGNSAENITRWKHDIDSGKVLGPHIFAAGPFVDGPRPLFPGSTVSVATAEDGRTVVTKLKAGGSDFIKLQSVVPREAYFALAAEARKQNVPFAGHVPVTVAASEAARAGQKSMEHFTGFLLESSSSEAGISEQISNTVHEKNFEDAAIVREVFLAQPPELLSTYDPQRARKLISVFQENHTWQDPTFTMLQTIAYFRDVARDDDPRMQYMPVAIRKWWIESFLAPRRLTEEEVETGKKFYARYVEIFRMMHDSGIEFLAGTDVGFPYVFPGYSLHEELELEVNAGLTPREALRIATYNPAKYFGVLNSLGTIEKGKIADMVLLDADPLVDIANTRKINSVVVKGRLLEKSDLRSMLEHAAEYAKAQ